MNVELKAEYEWRTVLQWHIVPSGDSTALCGRLLAPAAETKPIPAAHDGEVCERCGAADKSAAPHS
ncbi:hypothetical protein [Streptacidiphilus rugosus]|uniref:hypothetical protein n=1 Tax=Streptacidiphilus rugosus TaxID=405783 RepID=UPI0012FBFD58|nr:hypothetical protein [Streptacidiphilus rugosus]